jgi:hypothetical protein
LEVHEKHDVKAFLEKLLKTSKSHVTAIVRRLDATCESGLVWNDNHTRALRHNAKPVCEFKAGQTRILWFRDKLNPQILICTNAFTKKSDGTPLRDIDRAHSRMEAYYKNREVLLAQHNEK